MGSEKKIEVVRKMSVGIINGVKKGFTGIVSPTYLARFAGIARSVVAEETEAGTAFKFIGEFSGWNREGVEYAAPVVYLVGEAVAAVKDALERDAGKGIEFAYDFVAIPGAPKSAVRYTWQVVEHVAPRVSDPLGKLLAGLGEAPKATAPEPEPEKTPDPEPAASGGDAAPAASGKRNRKPADAAA